MPPSTTDPRGTGSACALKVDLMLLAPPDLAQAVGAERADYPAKRQSAQHPTREAPAAMKLRVADRRDANDLHGAARGGERRLPSPFPFRENNDHGDRQSQHS